MALLDTLSTGLSPEVVAAFNQQIEANVRTGVQLRVAYAPGSTIEVYVDGVDGNDANDGSAKYPLKTIDQVYRAVAFSAVSGSQIVVNLAGPKSGNTPVEYPIYELLFSGHSFRGPDMVLAPVSASSAALDAGSPATSQTNRTRLNFTTANPGWSTNELRGYFVRIKRDGALQFPEMPIAENDGTHLWVNTSSLAAGVLATDTVEIVRPAVTIVGTDTSMGGPLLLLAGQQGLSFLTSCAMERIAIGNFFSPGLDTSLGFDRCRLECPDVGIAIGRFSFINTSCVGNLVINGWVDNPLASSRQNYAEGKFVDLLVSGGILQIGDDSIPGHFRSNYDVSVYDSPSSGIICQGPASYLVARKSGSTIQGDNNAAVGIHAKKGGRVRVADDANKTTITGAGGDLKVGNGAAVGYGSGAGDFREEAGWNGNFTRMLEGTATAPTGDTSQIECRF